ncbi:MAG: SDR family oxidoreductase, partial [Xanthobacteraceae bacterium]
MSSIPYRTALIVGAGPGISASVARALKSAGLRVGLAARNADRLAGLASGIGTEAFVVDAASPEAVAQLFERAEATIGAPDVVVYNASARSPGPIADIKPQ